MKQTNITYEIFLKKPRTDKIYGETMVFPKGKVMMKTDSRRTVINLFDKNEVFNVVHGHGVMTPFLPQEDFAIRKIITQTVKKEKVINLYDV